MTKEVASMRHCSTVSPFITLLAYNVEDFGDVKIDLEEDRNLTQPSLSSSDKPTAASPGTNAVLSETVIGEEKDNETMMRAAYERYISRDINQRCVRQGREEKFVALLHKLYSSSFTIPIEVTKLILDFEQDDSLQEIFTLFRKCKTRVITSIYIIPYVLGWIHMLIFAYLASEYWNQLHGHFNQLQFLQLLGVVLMVCTSMQTAGCYFCLKSNTTSEYLEKLSYLKSCFLAHGLLHKYDNLLYMKGYGGYDGAWELFIPFQKWCGALRVQNTYNVRGAQCTPRWVVAFYLLKPLFCFLLGVQMATLSPHCLVLWLAFCLVFCILVAVNVFNKSVVGSSMGSTALMLIISATSIDIWPEDFGEGLRTSFGIFLTLIFLLYLFSLYLICCSGRTAAHGTSANMLGIWMLLFVCYLMYAELAYASSGDVNIVLMLSLYFMYVAFQMLLLTSTDVQMVGTIKCGPQMKFLAAAIFFAWLIDLDTLSYICSEPRPSDHGAHEDAPDFDALAPEPSPRSLASSL